MDDEEFSQMLGNLGTDGEGEDRMRMLADDRGRNLQGTNEVNWADSGHLIPVKDQG